jgi:hypothetical protein
VTRVDGQTGAPPSVSLSLKLVGVGEGIDFTHPYITETSLTNLEGGIPRHTFVLIMSLR